MNITTASKLQGALFVPGDKSITHRGIMLGSISNGITEIKDFLNSADCFATISCFQKLGVKIKSHGNSLVIYGNGLYGLGSPTTALHVANSGTTARLLTGILCGQSFPSVITGDASLSARPMERIMTPLTLMGAHIVSMMHNNCAPLRIAPRPLHGITYTCPIASAQIKSSVLLAGLYAPNPTNYTEPMLSRNHTELMLAHFGATIKTKDRTTLLYPSHSLEGQQLHVPGDISSAAYLIAAALIVPNSELLLKQVGINPTRSGMLSICEKMGAKISISNVTTRHGELIGDLLVRSSTLHGVTIDGDTIPSLIDELPILAVLGAFASGTTVIKDASELKVKESNRLTAIATNLTAMGASVTPLDDGIVIDGGKPLHGTVIHTYQDHRIAMAFTIAGLAADTPTTICDSECVDISYPHFFKTLSTLQV